MKGTGPTKKSNRLLIRRLEKASVAQKQKIWKRVAQLISKPRRQRSQVNLSKLEALSKRFKGKIFLVAGKVLGSGSITNKVDVVALEFSQSARKKIVIQKGKCLGIGDVLEQKAKPASIMIVK